MAVKNEVKVDKKDFFRVILSETVPSDTPIIFSNDGFYKICKIYFSDKSKINTDVVKIFEDFTSINDQNKYRSAAQPFKYNILRNETKVRGLSLLHPRVQILLKDFVEHDFSSIIYFCTKSNFSIRKQCRVASYFTPKMDEHNDNSAVSSFFAIDGIDRLYKFFESKEFISLESKYPFFASSDISNCFNSIYTHTIPWATHGKKYNSGYIRNKNLFGSKFDSLMQISNGNETHGIAIGNEISRIFAEILFQKIDLVIENRLEKEGYTNGVEYKIFRYVDDYFIFSLNREILSHCIQSVSESLHELNFTLNESKTKIFERPFFSKSTCAAVQAKSIISELERNIFDKPTGDSKAKKRYKLKVVFNPRGMASAFISKIRSACLTNESKFEDVSSLIIGAMRNKIKHVKNSEYIESGSSPLNTLILLVEISFFFFKVNPQSSNSRTMSLIVLTSDEIVGRVCLNSLQYFREVLKEHINHFITSKINAELNSKNSRFFPFEKINILLSTSFFEDYNKIPEETLLQIVINKDLNYFDIISLIYYTQGGSKYVNLIKLLEECIINILSSKGDVDKSSEKCHLSLDIISCPFVSLDTKVLILRKNFPSYRSKNHCELQDSINEISTQMWFVDWKQLDLVKLIAEKELIRGY